MNDIIDNPSVQSRTENARKYRALALAALLLIAATELNGVYTYLVFVSTYPAEVIDFPRLVASFIPEVLTAVSILALVFRWRAGHWVVFLKAGMVAFVLGSIITFHVREFSPELYGAYTAYGWLITVLGPVVAASLLLFATLPQDLAVANGIENLHAKLTMAGGFTLAVSLTNWFGGTTM